jgi:hypothetical protein
MSVFDCSCYDGETGKVLLKLITTVEGMETLPDGLTEKGLKELKNQIKTCGFDGQQGKNGGGGGDGSTSKKGRKLSQYQIEMGNCMRSTEKGGQGKPFMDCIAQWKAKKNG